MQKPKIGFIDSGIDPEQLCYPEDIQGGAGYELVNDEIQQVSSFEEKEVLHGTCSVQIHSVKP